MSGTYTHTIGKTTDWIMTASGRPFWPLEPNTADVSIEDIAHHLSHLCRFTGAVRTFYSVAQHSVYASQALAPGSPVSVSDTRWRRDGLFGLLHDAAEAYLMDVPRPLKKAAAFAEYRRAEEWLGIVIYRALGLDPREVPPELKVIDRRLLRTEQAQLMPSPALDEQRDDVLPLPLQIVPWEPARAKWHFLDRYQRLTGQAGR